MLVLYMQFKGTVSRDLHICFFLCQSMIWSSYTLWSVFFAYKISFVSRIFQFTRLGVVSLPCEWSWEWAIRLSAAPFVAPYWEPTTALMQMLFWRTIFEDVHCPSPGHFTAPYLWLPELSIISCVKPMANFLPLSPGLGQGKLTMLRCEIRKIRDENEIQKANERRRKLRSIEWYTQKNICANLVRLSLWTSWTKRQNILFQLPSILEYIKYIISRGF
jgi:hypothetical protein